MGMWTPSCIRPGFPASYQQSVDAYAEPGHTLATALPTSYPQFPARRRSHLGPSQSESICGRAAMGCTSVRDPAKAGSLNVWHLGVPWISR